MAAALLAFLLQGIKPDRRAEALPSCAFGFSPPAEANNESPALQGIDPI
jgi:hypothetical protein